MVGFNCLRSPVHTLTSDQCLQSFKSEPDDSKCSLDLGLKPYSESDTVETRDFTDLIKTTKGYISNTTHKYIEIAHRGTISDIFNLFDLVEQELCQSVMPTEVEPGFTEPVEAASPAIAPECPKENGSDTDTQLHEKLQLDGEKKKELEDMVAQLAYVEGFTDESWGQAVDIDSPCAFYPTTLTSGLNQDEFLKFIESSDSEDSVNENNSVALSGQSNSEEIYHSVKPLPNEKGTCSSGSGSTNNNEILQVIPVTNEVLVTERKLNPYDVPTDPRRPPHPAHEPQGLEYSHFLNANINEIPDEDITAEFVLRYVLQAGEVEKLSNLDTQYSKSLPDALESEENLVKNVENQVITTETCQNSQEDDVILIDSVGSYEEGFLPNDFPSQKPVEESNTQVEISEKTTLLETTCMNVKNDQYEEVSDHCEEANNLNHVSNPVTKMEHEISNDDHTKTFASHNSSQVSVASSSSSCRPCSVILTKIDPASYFLTRVPGGQANDSEINHSDLPAATSKSQEPYYEQPVEEVETAAGKIDPVKKNKRTEKPISTSSSRLTSNVKSVPEKSPKSLAQTNEPEPLRVFEKIVVSNQVKAEPGESMDKNKKTHKNGRSRRIPCKRTSKDVFNNSLDNQVTVKKEKLEDESKTKPVSQMNTKETLDYIRKESAKDRPDITRLAEAMKNTYAQYRKSTYSQTEVTLKRILKFHGLNHYQIVKQEYDLITDKSTKMEHLERELEGVFPRVLEPKVKGKKKVLGKATTHPLCEKAKEIWKSKNPDPQYCKVLGILLVCFEFAEISTFNNCNLFKILKEGEKLTGKDIAKMKRPTIVVKEDDIFKADEECDIAIYVDCAQYLTVPNIYEAVLSAFATYYLLNITYGPKVKSLFEFFDMLNGNTQSTYSKINNILTV